MHRPAVVLVLFAACLLPVALCHAGAAPGATPRRNGLNFLNGQWSAPKYNSTVAVTSLGSLRNQTNAAWIALTYAHFQWSVDSVGPIYERPSTPHAQELTAIVAEAKRTGIHVFFRPCIDPDWSNPAAPGTWRGEIGRNFNTSDWDTWFGFYLPFIVAQARLAQLLAVDMLAVGMEYVVASQQAAHWRAVVAAVRAVYTAGPVTYCANHGNEGTVAWWDAVDEISIDAYYVLLGNDPSPSVAALVAAWQPIVASLGALSATNSNKRINFAEIGYCSTTGANTNPAQCGSAAVRQLNLTAQTHLYTAFFEAVYGQPWFGGVFWWAWLTDPSNGGPTDAGFSPNGKPAAAMVAKYFSTS